MTARIDHNLYLNSVAQDRVYTADQVATVLDSAITGGGGGGGGTTTNRTHQMATYQTFTSPAHVYFTALATDAVTVIVPRTQTGVTLIASSYHLYGYDIPLTEGLTDYIAVWDEGDPNNFTLAWEVVGGGTGIVTPPVDHGGTGLAQGQFVMAQSTSSLVTLNATGSIADTYAWEIDGTPRPETTPIVTYGPLKVGAHTVRLTVRVASDASFEIIDQTIQVAWIGSPFSDAQHDNTNGLPGGGLNFAVWSPLPAIGPFRVKEILNEQAGGDGDPRVWTNGDGSTSLFVKSPTSGGAPGDRPGTSGGYRAAMQWNNAYNGTLAGYPLGVANIDVWGAGNGSGSNSSVRFHRVEILIPSTTPTGSTPTPLLYMNNFWEGEVPASAIGRPSVSLCTDSGGTNIAWTFSPCTGGTDGTQQTFALTPIIHDVWFNYVLEYLWHLDPGVGYLRLYKDGVVVLSGMPAGTDGTGKYFAATARTDTGSNVVQPAMNFEVYRTKSQLDAHLDYPDIEVRYRNARTGPTLASVYP